MDDLISRREAIDALDGNVIVTSRESAQAVMDYIRGCADRIRSLPSAQPCYKTDHGYMWLCPECGLAVHSDYDRCVRCGWERRTDETD